jgi:hypothetical protein
MEAHADRRQKFPIRVPQNCAVSPDSTDTCNAPTGKSQRQIGRLSPSPLPFVTAVLRRSGPDQKARNTRLAKHMGNSLAIG